MKCQKKLTIIFYLGLFIFIEGFFYWYIKSNDLKFFNLSPDGILYYNMAENFVNGNGLTNTVRKEYIIVPPLFSLLLSPFVVLFDSVQPFFYVQFLLYGVNGLFLCFLTNKLSQSKINGLISGMVYGIHPVLLLNGPQYLLTETIFITFILLTVFLSIKWIINPKKSNNLFWLIIFLSFSLLYRPHMIYVFLIIFLFLLYFIWNKQQSIRSILLFLIPIIFLSINGVHNLLIHNEFVPLENYSGQNLYIANNPETDIAFYSSKSVRNFVEPFYFELTEKSLSDRSTVLKEIAISYIVHHPIDTFTRILAKSKLFFQGINKLDTWIIIISFIGLIVTISTKKDHWKIHIFILLFIIGFTLLTSLGLLVHGQRYRAPLVPVYLIYFGLLVGFVIDQGKKLLITTNKNI